MKTILITCFAILTLSVLAACSSDSDMHTSTTSSDQSAMVDSKDMHPRPANQ